MNRSILRACGLLFLVVLLAPADQLPPEFVAKWSQGPDMTAAGTDFHSMHQANGTVVADDFRSDGRIIRGFRWWGSYIAGDPGLASGDQRQVQFELSFHADVPAVPGSVSQPANAYVFQILNAWEYLYGQDANGKNVYEYWALLNTPWTEIAGNIYWFDAAMDVATVPAGTDWGRRSATIQWNDFAVQTLVPGLGGNPHTGTWAALGQDVSFEVLTDIPEPAGILLLGTVLAFCGAMARRKLART